MKGFCEYVNKTYNVYQAARIPLESVWLETWAEYLSTDSAIDWLRNHQFKATRSKLDKSLQDWKHRVHTGKAFEAVELVWSYFMQASFPSSNWFEVIPSEDTDDIETAEFLKRFYRNHLDCINFRATFGDALRQLLVTGTTCMHVSLCPKTKKPKFSVIDNFNYVLEPNKPVNEAAFIRTLRMPRHQVKAMVDSGRWKGSAQSVNKLIPVSVSAEETDKDTVSGFSHIRTDEARDHSPSDIIQLLEYWGPLYDGDEYVGDGTAVVSSESILYQKVTKEPRPYVVCCFINLPNRAWGVSTLIANLGLLHADRSFLNARLDNLSATCHNMWEVVEDGVVDPEFKFYPGAKIPVRQPGSIIPVPIGQSNLSLTYQEEQLLGQRIDRNMGTIPSVGTGPQRKAERVTAQEIEASQEAGGTRLNQYHNMIERGLTNPILQLYHTLWSKVPGYVKTVLPNQDNALGSYEVKPSELCCCKVDFRIKGSEAVITKASKVNRYTEFLSLVLSSEILSQQVNINYVLQQIVMLWGFDEPEKVLQVEKPEPQVSPQEEMLNSLPSQPMANAVESQLMADGGANLAQTLAQNGQ